MTTYLYQSPDDGTELAIIDDSWGAGLIGDRWTEGTGMADMVAIFYDAFEVEDELGMMDDPAIVEAVKKGWLLIATFAHQPVDGELRATVTMYPERMYYTARTYLCLQGWAP